MHCIFCSNRNAPEAFIGPTTNGFLQDESSLTLIFSTLVFILAARINPFGTNSNDETNEAVWIGNLTGETKNLDGWTINDEVRQNAPFELSGVLTTIGHYKYFITTLWYRRRCRTHVEQLMYLMIGN